MPVAGSIKRITNPQDEEQFIDLRIVDEVSIKHGQGGIFSKYRIKFENHGPTTARQVEEVRVFHRALDQNGNPVPGDEDDEDQYVDIERLKSYIEKHGQGGEYSKDTTIHLDESQVEGSTRGYHTVRIYGEDADGANQDIWIDVRRTDNITIKHGQGGIYQKSIIFVEWNDEAFDAADAPLHEGGGSGFDPPWRLDPLQEIVNVKWKDEEESDFIFLLLIERYASLAFQNEPGHSEIGSARFWRVPHDYSHTIGPDNRPLTSTLAPNYVTGFRYIWQSQRPENVGTLAVPVWEDQTQIHPIEWMEVPEGQWSGLPSLPIDVSVPRETIVAGVDLGGIGGGTLVWHPQAQWDQPTGPDLVDEILAPLPTGDVPFKRGTSVTIYMIGVSCHNSGKVDAPGSGFGLSWMECGQLMGFIPEGGYVPHADWPDGYNARFGDRTFELSGISVTRLDEDDNPVIWKPVAVAVDQRTEVAPISQPHPPGVGAVYVLCKRADDPEWFP